MFNHTGENGFKCNVCAQTFNRNTRLRSHMKTAHNITISLSNLKCETIVKPNDNDVEDEDNVNDDEQEELKQEFKCKVCGCLDFETFENLVKHMNELHRYIYIFCFRIDKN